MRCEGAEDVGLVMVSSFRDGTWNKMAFGKTGRWKNQRPGPIRFYV